MSNRLRWLSFISQFLLLRTVQGFSDIHNSVIGLPQITCERDFIRFEVQTEKPFRGKVFVKGEYGNAHCTRTYNNGHVVIGVPPVASATISPYWNTYSGNPSAENQETTRNPSRTQNQKPQNNNLGPQGGSETDPFGRDPRQGANHGNANFRNDFEQGVRHNSAFGPSPPGAIPTSSFGGSTMDPRFGHASGQVDSGEVNGAEDTTLTQNQLPTASPQLRVFMGKTGNPNSSNGNNVGSTARPPGFATGPPGIDGSATNGHLVENQFAGGKPGHNGGNSIDNEWSQSTRAPEGRTTAALTGQGFGRESEKIFPSQCPSTCAPCACDDFEDDFEHSARGRRQAQNSVTLEVPLGECRAKRDRVVSPPGVYVSFVAVISFHENFITKLDRAYHIKCAYQESNKTVETQIDVSNPPPEDLASQVQPPQCQYRLRTPDGQEIRNRNVQVGDVVRHEWSCVTPLTGLELYKKIQSL